MASIKIKTITDKNTWEDYVISRSPSSFLQSWNWGEVNKNMGDKVFRKGFYRQEKLLGVAQIIKKKAKRGDHLLIAGGPFIDFENKELFSNFISEISKLAKAESVWFVRVRPELLDNNQTRQLFESKGFIRAPMHLNAENTQVIDIDISDKKLLYQMRKNTRYSVRKSLEQGLKLEITTDPDRTSLLYDLQKNTARRHGFVGFSRELFYEQLSAFGKDDQSALFLVRDAKDKIHVAAIIIFYGKKAYYHHSASSEASRDNYSSYFLQWKVIQEARRRGCTRYNLWGVSPSLENKNHRFYGVSIFKKGFGGEQIDWLPAHDYRISPLYWSTYIFERFRKIKRGL